MYAPRSVPQRGVVDLNFSGCQSWLDVVRAVKAAFDIPDFYGTNLDALWDCLRDFGGSWAVPIEIQIRNYRKLSGEARKKASDIIGLLDELCEKYPHIHYTVLN